MIETNWLWWHSFLVFVGKEKTHLLFYCIEHDNGIKIVKHRYNLVQIRNRLNFGNHQCAWLSELKSSNQIYKINISLLPAWTKTKTNRILSRKCCHQVSKPASLQHVQQFSDLINSLQCILLQLQEMKWTYAKIGNFDPRLFICIPSKFQQWRFTKLLVSGFSHYLLEIEIPTVRLQKHFYCLYNSKKILVKIKNFR